MNTLTPVEKELFEELLDTSSGYVLEKTFSNSKFSEFFRKYNINIDAKKYLFNGGSKAKRLRAFLEISNDKVVGKTLESLLEIWHLKNPELEGREKKLYEKGMEICARLQGKAYEKEAEESEFLKKQFENLDVGKIGLDPVLLPVIKNRLDEAKKCMEAEAPLAVIFLTGSILEGILLHVADKNPSVFNQARSAPKDAGGKVKKFPHWSLAQLIDAAHEGNFLELDVQKFGHVLRNFRNYIHPHEQYTAQFQPKKRTAEICLQVLNAAIADLSKG